MEDLTGQVDKTDDEEEGWENHDGENNEYLMKI
jgi:hypothetical protein